jgi:TolB protein
MPAWTLLVACIATALLSGCASTPSEWLADSDQRPAARRPQPAPLPPRAAATPSPSPADSIEFTTPETQSPRRDIKPTNLAMISLYGEIEGTPSGGGSPFDGDSNLAQISFATEGACVDPDVDRTGTWLAFASTMHRTTSDIYMKSVRGKTQTQITTDPADDVMPAFSPDGKTLAFASNRAGNWDVYCITLEGGRTVQVSNDADHELHPSWSPDGRMIAYCKFGAQSARWEMWVVDVNNPGVRHFLDYGVFPQWCPDVTKNKILFQRAKQRGSRDYSIWTIDYAPSASGGAGQASHPTEIVSAANAALINPAWSPDGNRIAFVTVIEPQHAVGERPGQSDIWVVNLDGSGRTSLTNGQFANFQPAWACDSSVYFISDRSGVDNVWAVLAARATASSAEQGSGRNSGRNSGGGVANADGFGRESRP